jgi:hypothetical protein
MLRWTWGIFYIYSLSNVYIFQDYTVQPPMQELVVQDLHDNTWTFRHIYRGEDTDICLYFGTITLGGFEL